MTDLSSLAPSGLPSEAFWGLLMFAFASSITPGPNNMIVAASGANFGFRRTIPNMVGIEIGFGTMCLLMGMGAGAFVTAFPEVERALRYIAIAYLLYLSWRIATAGRSGATEKGKPLTVTQAALFQLVNPKAWAMALTASAAFLFPGLGPLGSGLLIAGTFVAIGIFTVSLWTGFGVAIGRLLKSDRALRIFNVSLGLLTAASAAMMI
ncbi:MAG TPA: LysE family translocator [Azospirillaceae bacterium]|nr:LysE family translocator [Azospirillaceae bacterium]